MTEALEKLLDSIDWSRYRAAKGSATEMPQHLRRLFSGNTQAALQVAVDFDCLLRDDHEILYSVALPTFPFLLHALELPNAAIVKEVLVTISVLAVRTAPDSRYSMSAWHDELRQKLFDASNKFFGLLEHPDDRVAQAARGVCDLLDIRPANGFPARVAKFCDRCGVREATILTHDVPPKGPWIPVKLCEPCCRQFRPEILWAIGRLQLPPDDIRPV